MPRRAEHLVVLGGEEGGVVGVTRFQQRVYVREYARELPDDRIGEVVQGRGIGAARHAYTSHSAIPRIYLLMYSSHR